MRLWLCFYLLVFAVSCTIVSPRVQDEKNDSGRSNEVSLQEDKAKLEELRKDIPAAVKVSNDQLADILKLMGEIKMKPQEIRSRFQREMNKRRSEHRKSINKERENFRKQESKEKKEFLDTIAKERKEFKSVKSDREAQKEFFKDQDSRRREFFNIAREKRSDFESKQRQVSKDFESNSREHNSHFNEVHRDYIKRYQNYQREQKKLKDQKTSHYKNKSKVTNSAPSPEVNKIMKEFEEMDQVKSSTKLGP